MSNIAAGAREQCHATFNNTAFADVVMAADRILTEAADGTVTTRRVAATLGISDSIVRPVMVRLVAARLLDELPKMGATNGPRLFRNSNEDRWAAMCALIATIHPPDTSSRIRRSAKRS